MPDKYYNIDIYMLLERVKKMKADLIHNMIHYASDSQVVEIRNQLKVLEEVLGLPETMEAEMTQAASEQESEKEEEPEDKHGYFKDA